LHDSTRLLDHHRVHLHGRQDPGEIFIKDETGHERSFLYTENLLNQCPYIHHNGNTGAVSVNDPANGDFKVETAHWSASEAPEDKPASTPKSSRTDGLAGVSLLAAVGVMVLHVRNKSDLSLRP